MGILVASGLVAGLGYFIYCAVNGDLSQKIDELSKRDRENSEMTLREKISNSFEFEKSEE